MLTLKKQFFSPTDDRISKSLGMPFIPGMGEAQIDSVRILVLKLFSYTGKFGSRTISCFISN